VRLHTTRGGVGPTPTGRRAPRTRTRTLAPTLVLALTLTLAGVALAGPAVLEGQGAVTGAVLDERGAPLARAMVVVAGSDRAAVTDAAGRFTLRGLPSAHHRLEARLVGYAPSVRDVVVDGDGTAEVTFHLRPTPLALPGLVVTGAPTAGAALDLARSASQLSGRALERRLGSSVAETLSGQPGLAVRYNGPGAAAPVVRGLTGDRVVLMQDGHRTADLAGSAEDHIVTMDPLSAQRIEVVRGPAALLYGNNALGGVVNVLTVGAPTHAPSRTELSGAVQVESAYPGATAHGRATVPLSGGWSMAVGVSGRATEDVRVAPGPAVGDRLPDSWLRHGSGTWSLGYGGPRVTGGATVRYFGFGYGVPTPPEDDESLRIDGRMLSASARFEVGLGSKRFPSIRLAATASDYAHDELESGVPEMAFGLRTQTVDVQLRQGAGGVLDEGAWGASLISRDYVASGADQLTAPAVSRSGGVFTYQQIPVGAGASAQLGVRADHYVIESRDDPRFGPGIRRAFTAVSGSVGATVALSGAVSGALSAARSFRAPTVEELFSDAPHAGTAAYEVGDPSLEPETLRGVDAILRVRGARLVGEASVYASRIDDFITFEARGDTLIDGAVWPVLAYVQERADMHGVEGSLDWLAGSGWVVGVQGDLVRGALVSGDPVPFLPPARLGATARWEPGALSVGAAVRHALAQRRVTGGPDVATDAYTLVDLDAGLRLTRGSTIHSVTLRVGNATNRHYRDAASRIKRFAPNPGRNVALMYRVTL
jgi:iron complex outermembrane recepter protein